MTNLGMTKQTRRTNNVIFYMFSNIRNLLHVGRTYKVTITILFLLSLNAFSATNRHRVIQTIKTNKKVLVEAFIYVESRGDEKAINRKTNAVGVLQITSIMIKEANRLAGKNKYKLSDRYNREKSIEIFHFIMQHKNKSYNIEKACRVWNPNGKQSYIDEVKRVYHLMMKGRKT